MPPARMLQPLRQRDFALLWAGMAVSLLGDGIYYVGIAWLTYELANTPTALSLVGVAWTVPLVLLLLLGGVVSDRVDRRRVMIAADVVRGLAVAAIGLLALSGRLELWHLLVLVALYGAGDAFFAPAFGAIVPEIVPREQLVQANSLDQFVRPIAVRLAGPALGGLLAASFGVGSAFLFDAATFAVSATAVLAMRARPRPGRLRPAGGGLGDVGEALRFVRGQTWLWGTLVAAALALLLAHGPSQVLIPYLVKNSLGGQADDLGLVYAVGGVGAVAAALAMGEQPLPQRCVTFMYLAWTLGVLGMAGIALASNLWHAMVANFLIQGCFAAGLIVWGTLLHRLVPGQLLGRVTSLDWMVSISLTPISYALAGPIAERVGAAPTLLWAAVLGAGASLAFLFLPRLRDVERDPALIDSRGVPTP